MTSDGHLVQCSAFTEGGDSSEAESVILWLFQGLESSLFVKETGSGKSDLQKKILCVNLSLLFCSCHSQSQFQPTHSVFHFSLS